MKFLFPLVAALVLLGCGQSESGSKSATRENTQDYLPEVDSLTRFAGNSQAGDPVQKQDPGWDRKILRTGNISVEVKDAAQYYTAVRSILQQAGGYIASEEQSQNTYRVANSVVLKVPAQQFEHTVSQLTSSVSRVEQKKISSQDVTGEFLDTRARLEAKKRVRERYLGLLNQAKNMEEILTVQREINSIQEEIEAASGRIAFLGQSAVFSTIHLDYYQVLDPAAREDVQPGIGARILMAVKTGWSWMEDLLLGILSIWPLVLATLAIIIVIRKRRNPASRPQ